MILEETSRWISDIIPNTNPVLSVFRWENLSAWPQSLKIGFKIQIRFAFQISIFNKHTHADAEGSNTAKERWPRNTTNIILRPTRPRHKFVDFLPQLSSKYMTWSPRWSEPPDFFEIYIESDIYWLWSGHEFFEI